MLDFELPNTNEVYSSIVNGRNWLQEHINNPAILGLISESSLEVAKRLQRVYKSDPIPFFPIITGGSHLLPEVFWSKVISHFSDGEVLDQRHRIVENSFKIYEVRSAYDIKDTEGHCYVEYREPKRVHDQYGLVWYPDCRGYYYTLPGDIISACQDMKMRPVFVDEEITTGRKAAHLLNCLSLASGTNVNAAGSVFPDISEQRIQCKLSDERELLNAASPLFAAIVAMEDGVSLAKAGWGPQVLDTGRMIDSISARIEIDATKPANWRRFLSEGSVVSGYVDSESDETQKAVAHFIHNLDFLLSRRHQYRNTGSVDFGIGRYRISDPQAQELFGDVDEMMKTFEDGLMAA